MLDVSQIQNIFETDEGGSTPTASNDVDLRYENKPITETDKDLKKLVNFKNLNQTVDDDEKSEPVYISIDKSKQSMAMPVNSIVKKDYYEQ